MTLKLVVADYGTGPANTSKKYWQGIANAFEKQSPSIKVAITDIPWTNFDGCGSAGGTSCRGGWGGNNCAGVAGFV